MIGMSRNARRKWSLIRLELAIGGVLLVIAAVVYIPLTWFALHRPDMLLTADIHTEHISFSVIDREKAAFFIRGFRVAERGEAGACEDGLLTPSLGTSITYGRVGDGPVEITLNSPPGSVDVLDRGDGNPRKYTNLVEMAQDESCLEPRADLPGLRAEFSPMRFPIWGPAQIGKEFRPSAGFGPPEPSLLIDGKIDVSAHAWCASWLTRGFCSRSPYEVRTLTLPVASRLETPTRATWWGVAYVDRGKTALIAAVTTEAPELNLYRPGRPEAELISIPTLVQLTEDPTIIRVHLLILVVVAVAGTAAWLVDRILGDRSEGSGAHKQP